ncbi:MAG: tRNA pseudouridine(13) synthase TruD [Candidatus Asgardarchaeia archaeon]
MENLDRILGIYGYVTDEESSIKGHLKKRVEDFIVEEILPGKLPCLSVDPKLMDRGGNYIHAIVMKVNMTTLDMLYKLSKILHIRPKDISYAGIKDKRAIAYQRISIRWDRDDRLVSNLRTERLRILLSWRDRRHVKRGELWGNSFKVIIRDVSPDNVKKCLEGILSKVDSLGGVPNFFGYQRFGEGRPFSHILGMYLIKGDYERFVKELLNKRSKGGKKLVYENGMVDEYPLIERRVILYLDENPGDFLGAVKSMPRSIIRLCIHAYQSYLFNVFLSERIFKLGLPLNEAVEGDIVLQRDEYGIPLRYPYIVSEKMLDKVNRGIREGKLSLAGPIVGYKTVFPENEWGDIIRKRVYRDFKEHGFKNEDLKISARGSYRELLSEIFWKELPRYSKDKGKIELNFSLKRGCYATTLIREILKENMLRVQK